MSTSHSEFLKHVQTKREELNKIVALAHEIECMIDGLKSVVQLNNISIELPDDIRDFIITISDNIREDSSSSIKELIHSLDHQVHKSLNAILNKALSDISRDMDNEEIEVSSKKLNNVIKDFRQNVHTTIGARLILKDRNLVTPPFKCDVPINTITETITKLDHQEKILRSKIVEKIDEMIAEFSVFLENETIPESMKAHMLKTKDLLSERKKQLQNGETLSDITIFMDTIEIKSDEPIMPANINENRIETAYAPQEKQETQQKNGLLQRLMIWISTPMDIKWRDTKYYNQE